MMQGTYRRYIGLSLVITALSLGGCLSEETDGSAGGFTGGDPSPGNTPPSIAGSPGMAVMIGDTYSFTPTASDADGDSLTFLVQNLPSWATFNASTGTISGQPTLADVGEFANVVISVSDGQAGTSLPGFSITVTQGALGSMSLSWTPPQTNTDGTTLVDLAGYNVYYGESAGNYPNRVRIDNPSISTYVVENLIPKTYYVVATSFNSAGVESAYSNMAVKVVE
jgi:hypothetical protein